MRTETFDYGLTQEEIDDRNARFEHDDEQDSIRREEESFYADLKKEIESSKQ